MRIEEVRWPAVRAFRRVWGPKSEALGEAEAADAGFDAGEFSGPAHANIQLDEYNAALERVARRFGIEATALDSMVFIDYNYTMDQWIRALMARKLSITK